LEGNGERIEGEERKCKEEYVTVKRHNDETYIRGKKALRHMWV
jgi:hypothetical protein